MADFFSGFPIIFVRISNSAYTECCTNFAKFYWRGNTGNAHLYFLITFCIAKFGYLYEFIM